jgi:hypothetical protein
MRTWRARSPERARRVLHAHEVESGRRHDVLVHERRRGAARGGVRQEIVAVEARAGDRHEQLALLQRARVDRHPAHFAIAATREHAPAGRGAEFGERQGRGSAHGDHAFALRSSRATCSRATWRSSNGT